MNNMMRQMGGSFGIALNYFKAVSQSLEALEATVEKQTFLLSYMDAFLLLCCLNAVCIPLVILTIRKRTNRSAMKIEIPDH